MFNSPLEFLAAQYGNVVLYDDDGNPSLFVRFPKMKSSELAAGLPEHTHPAFIVNGEEQDFILLGKYKAGAVSEDAGCALASLPNIPPANGLDADEMLERIKLAGAGITGMTVADYGFLKLLAQKRGWEPRGNTLWGQSHLDGAEWRLGEEISEGAERAFKGVLYLCLSTHTTSESLRPDISPSHWQSKKFIGGTPAGGDVGNAHQASGLTLNGSGPLEWYFGGDTGSLSDLIGNAAERQYGYRLVDCELQILPDNNAAAPGADLSTESDAWRAILPNKNDGGYTLTAPGSAGTLHWNYLNDKITLDTQSGSAALGVKETNFKDLAVNGANLPFVPCIVKELGLFPTGGEDSTAGRVRIDFSGGEHLPCRGGRYNDGTAAGAGCVDAGVKRTGENAGNGCRPRALL